MTGRNAFNRNCREISYNCWYNVFRSFLRHYLTLFNRHPSKSILSLIPRPEETEEKKGPGFSRFVHMLKRSGIPPLPHIIDTRPTTRNIITILQCFFSHTSSDAEDPDHCLSYALQRLDSHELRSKPEQRSSIESVYREGRLWVVPMGNNRFIIRRFQ